ncbi:winged helix DNA-binding domain-containing protein [Streptomyces physcomitrii]|uniref:Winged helix DNA-binding domain-containing protein n=1 Tax=Streptomyces physcomitrii TaxID=2724184 RepID=A0ABX1H7N2_9ACTN|nr:winged helix DNA-binding domain-containing protein [Streptomyces physcomitrii]NKI44073.1 winged helix DNA-binding domain-containing protein [Streptomyces physcomitrii]
MTSRQQRATATAGHPTAGPTGPKTTGRQTAGREKAARKKAAGTPAGGAGGREPEVLSPRALGRATLARQLLLEPAESTVPEALEHLLGLQAQNVRPPYFALAARLARFRPEDLSAPMAGRQAVRSATLRSTLHTHTARDLLRLRPFVQPAKDRELHQFRKGLAGVDLDRLSALARELVEDEPRTMAQLRTALGAAWPDAEPRALAMAARSLLPLIQVTPRGLWGRGGQVALTTAEKWLGRAAAEAVEPLGAEEAVRRYLAAFGPASVKDMGTWCGLTGLRAAFEELRPALRVFRDEHGTELFDLPEAPRPDPDTPAPPRFLPEYDNLLLSHADRTRVVPPVHRHRHVRGNQAFRTLLLDGFLAGLWRLDEDGVRPLLTVELFEGASRAVRSGIEEEAGRLMSRMCAAGTGEVRFAAVAGPPG